MALVIAVMMALVAIFGSWFLISRIRKAAKGSYSRRYLMRDVIIVVFSMFAPLTGLFAIYAVGIAFDDHHDVRRGTLLWLVTMSEDSIIEFPQISPEGRVTFNKIGGNGISIGTGWEVEYFTLASGPELRSQIENHLVKKGFSFDYRVVCPTLATSGIVCTHSYDGGCGEKHILATIEQYESGLHLVRARVII